MKDLRKMTSKELKEIAKEMKISNWWNLKKAVLIEKIEKAQNMSDEEKQAIADQKAKEDAALAEYEKHWRKYTRTYNPIEFINGWRSGKIVLEDDVEEPIEEVTPEENKLPEASEKEDQPQETTKNDWETIAKENIKYAYTWIAGGYENSVLDGETSEEEQEKWIKNEALEEIYHEAISTKYTPDMIGGNAPKEMKRASKKFCMEYIIELFKNDGYELEMPEIKKGHPAPKRGALIEFDGKAQNICAWGKELGISPNTLYGRIYKMGWSVERAFTIPPRKTK